MTHPPESTHSLLASIRDRAATPRRRAGCFSVEPLLADLDVESCRPETNEFRAMEALIKRVTISRKLHAFYSDDVTAPSGDEYVQDPYSDVFCAGLLAVAATANDWKFLNAALRALDGMLAEPPVTDEDDRLAREADRVLEAMESHGA